MVRGRVQYVGHIKGWSDPVYLSCMDPKTHGQLVADAKELKRLDEHIVKALANFDVEVFR